MDNGCLRNTSPSPSNSSRRPFDFEVLRVHVEARFTLVVLRPGEGSSGPVIDGPFWPSYGQNCNSRPLYGALCLPNRQILTRHLLYAVSPK